MKDIKNTIIIGILVILFILTFCIGEKILTIEEKIDNIVKIEQTQLDIDTSDFSELKKAIERLDCYEDFIKVINDVPSKDPYYQLMLKVEFLRLILNESKNAYDIELSICEEQQNEFEKLGDEIVKLNQEFSKNE